MLLAVDDAHWADEPSLRFFGFLLPRLDDLPVVVALAARPAEPGTASDLLAQLVVGAAGRVVSASGAQRRGRRRSCEGVAVRGVG